MKISLALGPRAPLSRQTAWGCLTTNLTLPGFGTVVAGRKTGYTQVVLGLLGTGLTLVFGVRFIIWYFTRWPQLQQQADPFENLTELWVAVRWALLGVALFLAGWLWSLGSSLSILQEARRHEQSLAPPPIPPKIR